MRALVWAAEKGIHEFDTITERAGNGGGGWLVQGTVSGAAWDADFVQRMAAGSGAAHVFEQLGSRSGGEAGRVSGLRRDRKGREELGMLSRDWAFPESAGSGRDAGGAI